MDCYKNNLLKIQKIRVLVHYASLFHYKQTAFLTLQCSKKSRHTNLQTILHKTAKNKCTRFIFTPKHPTQSLISTPNNCGYIVFLLKTILLSVISVSLCVFQDHSVTSDSSSPSCSCGSNSPGRFSVLNRTKLVPRRASGSCSNSLPMATRLSMMCRVM